VIQRPLPPLAANASIPLALALSHPEEKYPTALPPDTEVSADLEDGWDALFTEQQE
jgi:hypothetical protein